MFRPKQTLAHNKGLSEWCNNLQKIINFNLFVSFNYDYNYSTKKCHFRFPHFLPAF
jgi:hypothetical protein